jgi:hypothetical protein
MEAWSARPAGLAEEMFTDVVEQRFVVDGRGEDIARIKEN